MLRIYRSQVLKNKSHSFEKAVGCISPPHLLRDIESTCNDVSTLENCHTCMERAYQSFWYLQVVPDWQHLGPFQPIPAHWPQMAEQEPPLFPLPWVVVV